MGADEVEVDGMESDAVEELSYDLSGLGLRCASLLTPRFSSQLSYDLRLGLGVGLRCMVWLHGCYVVSRPEP